MDQSSIKGIYKDYVKKDTQYSFKTKDTQYSFKTMNIEELGIFQKRILS